jgi:hypothetical protein
MAEQQESIRHSAIGGLLLISGRYGSGKTVLATTLENPALVTMIDFDQKSAKRAEALGIEYFEPNFEVDSPTDVDLEVLLNWFNSTISSANEDGKRKVLIIDNGSMLEDAFHLAVAKAPQKYGVKPANAQTGKYGGTNPGVGRIWKNFMNYARNRGYDCVVVCMHMSALWAGGAPVDKFKVKGNKTLTELSNLSLVLVRANTPNTPPRAIVGKEALGLVTFEDGEFKVFMALPPVVPQATWPNIYEYIDAAKDRKTFTEEERPTREELNRYGEWLTPEQLSLIMTVASNPTFSMSEDDATSTIEKNTPKLTSWDDVTKQAVANKGYSSVQGVREAVKPFFVQGMSFDEVYNRLPDKNLLP